MQRLVRLDRSSSRSGLGHEAARGGDEVPVLRGRVITGIRFYKGPNNTGTHLGHLWSRTGTLLGEATFTNETASGWQEVSFESPIPISADTTYVASYFAPVGRYALMNSYFQDHETVNYPLRALVEGASGINGVLHLDTSGFPTAGQLATNFWVDVVFMPSTAPPGPRARPRPRPG